MKNKFLIWGIVIVSILLFVVVFVSSRPDGSTSSVQANSNNIQNQNAITSRSFCQNQQCTLYSGEAISEKMPGRKVLFSVSSNGIYKGGTGFRYVDLFIDNYADRQITVGIHNLPSKHLSIYVKNVIVNGSNSYVNFNYTDSSNFFNRLL